MSVFVLIDLGAHVSDSTTGAMAAKCSLEVERMFGPIVRGCGSNFDFTLLFEETILFIGPLCFTIMLAAHRLWQLRSRQVVVHRGLLYLGKIVCCMYHLNSPFKI